MGKIRFTAAVAAAITIAAVAAMVGTGQPHAATTTVPPLSDEHLSNVAHRVGLYYHDGSPTQIHRVADIDRAAAIRLVTPEDNISGATGTVVDVIQEHGNFSVPSTPPDVPAPTGHILTVVVNREAGTPTDISLAEGSNPGPDLTKLGSPAPLP